MENKKIKGVALLCLGHFMLAGFIYFASFVSPSAISLMETILHFLWFVWILSVIVVGISMLADKKLFLFEELSLSSFILMLMFIIFCWCVLGTETIESTWILFNWIYFLCMMVALLIVLYDFFRIRGERVSPYQRLS